MYDIRPASNPNPLYSKEKQSTGCKPSFRRRRSSFPCSSSINSEESTKFGQYLVDLYCNSQSPYPHGPQIFYSYHEFMNIDTRAKIQHKAQAAFDYSQIPQRKPHYTANDPRSSVEATDYFMDWERYVRKGA
ncbi:hypothetical protein HOO65_070243 [Ceratocystis lukuohia]|uniref:Uncharacterized protein n=2 Tax=Ceratocystis TaxID=5157 RepID=A0A2C5XCJ0_9PEZI|nr:hypothetical protein CFIMG_007889RA00001 [Ceratocystis fimbriata CBS 114723]